MVVLAHLQRRRNLARRGVWRASVSAADAAADAGSVRPVQPGVLALIRDSQRMHVLRAADASIARVDVISLARK